MSDTFFGLAAQAPLIAEEIKPRQEKGRRKGEEKEANGNWAMCRLWIPFCPLFKRSAAAPPFAAGDQEASI